MILVACAPPSHKAPGTHTKTFSDNKTSFEAKPAEITAPIDWTPERISLVCAGGNCPAQVGALIFASAPKNGKIPLTRCTAFLIAPDLIMSNGHCDHTSTARGFFVTQKLVREVTGISLKVFDAGDAPAGLNKPDVATYKLDRAITEFTPLRLAAGPGADFKNLTAYAVFEGGKTDELRVESRTCLVRRHEAYFPFSVRELPETIVSFDCNLISGNSGSPLLNAQGEVEALHVSTKHPVSSTRPPENFDKVSMFLSTNVRCLELPGHKAQACVKTSPEEAGRRFQAAQKFETDKIKDREFLGSDRLATAYRTRLAELKASGEYEVLYLPKCRRDSSPLTSAVLAFEKIKTNFNEWAEVSTLSLGLNTFTVPAKLMNGNVYQLQMTWPAAQGEFARPGDDLRRQFPNTFNVELPLCPR